MAKKEEKKKEVAKGNKEEPKKDSKENKKAEEKKPEENKKEDKTKTKSEEKKITEDKKAKSEEKVVKGDEEKKAKSEAKVKVEDKKAKKEDKDDKAEKEKNNKTEAKKKDEANENNNNDKDNNTKDSSSGDKVEESNEVTDEAKEAEAESESCPVRLIYFDGMGRAELSRLIMVATGIEFQDVRLEHDEWERYKEDTPCNQVPILEFYGHTLAQSGAIARFLAKKTGLYGQDHIEQARADLIVDYTVDYANKLVTVYRANGIEEKAELVAEIFQVFLPRFFRNLQKMLHENGGVYFVGESLTYADLAVFSILHAFCDPENPFFNTVPYSDDRFTLLEKFPLLLRHIDLVYGISGVNHWIKTRPRGLF